MHHKSKKNTVQKIEPWQPTEQPQVNSSVFMYAQYSKANPQFFENTPILTKNKDQNKKAQNDIKINRQTKSIQNKKRDKFIINNRNASFQIPSRSYRDKKNIDLIWLNSLAKKDINFLETIKNGSPLHTTTFKIYDQALQSKSARKSNYYMNIHQQLRQRPESTCTFRNNEKNIQNVSLLSQTINYKDSIQISNDRLNVQTLQINSNSQFKKKLRNTSNLQKILRLKQDLRKKLIEGKYKSDSPSVLKIQTERQIDNFDGFNCPILTVKQKNQRILNSLIKRRNISVKRKI